MSKPKKFFSPRELMEISIDEMKKSISEHISKVDPKVGAVLATKEGEIISIAHRGELRAGNHAEYVLIERKNGNKELDGLVILTTLEPCVDRNPPKDGCGFRIIDARISKVYIGHLDPDPTVAGNGAEILKKNGIEIEYYDKDLELVIEQENNEYFLKASSRAKDLSQNELTPPVTTLEQELTEYNFIDFSEMAMKEFISRANLKYQMGTDDFKKFLTQRRLVKYSEMNERKIYRPTGLGLLLLGKNPENHFENSIVKFTTITDDGKTLIKDFKGPLVLIPDDIEQYLEIVIPQSISREEFRRKTRLDIPIKVFREVIINALVHRDYTLSTHQIKVYIYPDKIEVHSPGIPEYSLERFRNYNVPAISRNSKIALMFDEMELMEGRGFGMNELQNLKSKYGLPDPEFNLIDNYFVVTIYRGSVNELKDKSISQLNIKEKKGYDLIFQKGSITASEYATTLGVATRTAERHFEKMIRLNLILPQGEGRAKRYKIKLSE
jgi:ATP-dependent DNA helicase RecG